MASARNVSVAVLFVFSAVGLPAQESDAEGSRFFKDRVAPILRARCLGCHNEELKDGISFEDREGLLTGANYGPTIVPGKPEQSALIHAVRQDGDLMMPPGGKLSKREIETLTEWIRKGAPLNWDKALDSKPKPKDRNRRKVMRDPPSRKC